ncbi:MAG: helix-turn-helix domain-containing protein [Bacteroidota bacterium]
MMKDQDIHIEAQLLFLKQVGDLIPSGNSLVAELADLLEVSTDSAYRRLRGETPLSFGEIMKLCRTFQLSFDAITGISSDSVTFRYQPNGNTRENFIKYLDGIRNNLEILSKSKNSKIIYAAEDIPVFHHFQFPLLTSFKLFYWMKSVMNLEEYSSTKFSANVPGSEVTGICRQLNELYYSIPSVEIWTELTVNSILKQIQFYWESDLFEDRTIALAVCEDLIHEMESVRIQAEKSTKHTNEKELALNNGNFLLFLSEVEIGNNNILAMVNELKTLYISHFTYNLISTNSKIFCGETEKWLDNLTRKSVQISGISEKQRYRFFSDVNKTIESLHKKIRLE